MKKTIYLTFLLLLLHACKKDDNTGSNNNNNNPGNQPSKKDLLTAKPWKYKSWVADPPVKDTAGTPVSDVLAYKPACDRDDIIIFEANGNANFDQGPTKCDSSQSQSEISTWYFSNNESRLHIAQGAFTNIYTLDTITADSMRWSFQTQSSVTHHHTVVFVH